MTQEPDELHQRIDRLIEGLRQTGCARCGETHDFYSDDFDRLAISEEVKTYGKVEKTQVEVEGICLRCSKTTDQ